MGFGSQPPHTRPSLRPANTDRLAVRMKAATVILLLQLLGTTTEAYKYTRYQSEENVALYGKATQSSLLRGEWAAFGHASNAIDGNTEGTLALGSCTHTEEEDHPWWRVDLLKRYRITSVTITNRKDCCADRIEGAEIRIGDSLTNKGNDNPRCAVIDTIPAGGSVKYICSKSMVGRYVNVILPKKEAWLTLCEVKATAVPVPVVGQSGSYYAIDTVGRGETLIIG
ncbi:hypothetical protein MATL_G00125470 [Megalops atlanticus]|uniref:Fucolectin tachylectin-4 pentraxin-1 domain-containing protein n=1 Tax=Megalops atlanticus TaxID=7932 RepID=A0A9D3T6K8_MEGAT|nr:hypothetical protein MATL_G00125470 [Megalops atlanticus]